MKTRISHIAENIFLIMLLLMLLAVATFGQGRLERRSESNSRSNTGITKRTAAGNDSQEPNVVRERYNANSQSARYSYRETKTKVNNNTKKKTNNAYNHAHGNSKHHYNMPYGHYKKTVKHYHHPWTYSVWHFPAPWKYSRHAVLFRHHHGDYFYYHGSFYRYHPARGYYAVGIPAQVVFTYLPVGYEEIYLNGRFYYRYGDVYLEYTPAGYRIIPPPRGIYIAAHF